MKSVAGRLGRTASYALRSTDAILEKGSASVAVSHLLRTSCFQLQSEKHYSAYKKSPPEDEIDDPADLLSASRKGHLPRVNHSTLLGRVVDSQPAPSATDDELESRQEKIRDLLRTMTTGDEANGAFKFISDFFQPRLPPTEAAAAMARDLAAVQVQATTPLSSLLGKDESAMEDLAGRVIDTPDPLDESQELQVLAELRGLRRGSQRVVLQKLLQGGMLRADPAAMAEWKKIQAGFKPPEGFRMKVVDVNRTCKGTRSGGLYRFSTMVVVGNGEGVLGWGQGKAAEVNEAVKKAYQRACRNLYPIPRFNRHTIPEPATAKFGKVKVVMYPKSSGNGIVASTLVSDICKLAGIHDIGVKIHGSRNPRNTVKCLFEAFDGMKTHEEIVGIKQGDARKLTISVPPGRFGRQRMQEQA